MALIESFTFDGVSERVTLDTGSLSSYTSQNVATSSASVVISSRDDRILTVGVTYDTIYSSDVRVYFNSSELSRSVDTQWNGGDTANMYYQINPPIGTYQLRVQHSAPQQHNVGIASFCYVDNWNSPAHYVSQETSNVVSMSISGSEVSGALVSVVQAYWGDPTTLISSGGLDQIQLYALNPAGSQAWGYYAYPTASTSQLYYGLENSTNRTVTVLNISSSRTEGLNPWLFGNTWGKAVTEKNVELKLTSSIAYAGNQSLYVKNPNYAGGTITRATGYNKDQLYGRFMLRRDTAIGGGTTVITLISYNAAGKDFTIVQNTNNTVSLRTDNTVRGTTTATIETGVWYEVMWRFWSGGAGNTICELKILGETITSNDTLADSNVNSMRIGNFAGGGTVLYFDAWETNDSEYPASLTGVSGLYSLQFVFN